MECIPLVWSPNLKSVHLPMIPSMAALSYFLSDPRVSKAQLIFSAYLTFKIGDASQVKALPNAKLHPLGFLLLLTCWLSGDFNGSFLLKFFLDFVVFLAGKKKGIV